MILAKCSWCDTIYAGSRAGFNCDRAYIIDDAGGPDTVARCGGKIETFYAVNETFA